MKIIFSVFGTAAVRVSVDDVMPRQGLLQRDLVDYLNKTYNFNQIPDTSPGQPAQPFLQFQSGEFVHEEKKLPIAALFVLPDGDVVNTQDTTTSDIILNDFISRLDSEFGYRFGDAKTERLYASAIVVEPSEKFVKSMEAISAIQAVVNDLIDPGSRSYQLKRLSFSHDLAAQATQQVTVAGLIPPDFTIERRANEPFARNRFFSVAPLSTEAHIRMLEKIEKVIK